MDKDKALEALHQVESDIDTIIAQVQRGDWSAAQRGCRVVGAELDDLADEMLPVSLEEKP